MVGQFKDDRVQDHTHGMFNYNPGGSSAYTVNSSSQGFYNNASTGGVDYGRFGNTTRGKRKGVKYIIKVL